MHLFQRYHTHRLGDILSSDFALFELSIWLHVLARSMISIFIPIFLLKAGFSISEALIFYILYNILDLPFNFLAKWMIEKFGARIVVLLGTATYVAFYACLYFLTYGDWSLMIAAALFYALYDGLYWVGHIYLFMVCEDSGKGTTRNISFMYIAKRIAGMISPAIGAAILAFSTQKSLIVVSVSLLLLSAWPLFLLKHIKDKPDGKPVRFKEFFAGGKRVKEYIIQGFYAFHGSAEGIIWPIFIFTIYHTTESVAMIPIITSVAVVVFTYFSSKLKQGNRRRTMAIGALLIALTWGFRLFIDNNVFLFLSVFLMAIFSVMVSLPLDSTLFEKGKKKDALSAATYRNFFSMLPRFMFYGVLFLLVEIFQISFLTAMVGMMMIFALNFIWITKGRKFKNVPKEAIA